MKQGWEIKKLGDVCDIQGGATPKRTESLYWEGGTYPWFTIEDIREQGHIIADTKQKITKVAWDRLRVFPKDTIMLCCTASIGEYAITHIPLTSNQQFNGLMIKDKSYLSPMYLMHYCATLKDKLAMLSGKATIDFVSAEKVRQIPIPVPSLAEQERIVEVLDREFERIDALKANAEQNLQHAKNLFQAALRKELQPKEGWEQHLLADVCEYKKEQGYYTHLPFVGMENIESGTGKLIGCQNGEKILSTTFRFQKGFVMYGRLRPYLKKVFVADFEGCCSTEIFPIVVNGVLPNFLMYWFLSDFTTDKINATCGGCRMPRANMNVVKQFYIWLPLLEEQEQIVARLDNINERCKALEENYKKTIALCDDMKQALLRKAFNGEL